MSSGTPHASLFLLKKPQTQLCSPDEGPYSTIEQGADAETSTPHQEHTFAILQLLEQQIQNF